MAKAPVASAEAFTSGRDMRSIPSADERLIPYDLLGSQAHVVMLARQKILPRLDARKLIQGLKDIENSWRQSHFQVDPGQEDVHSQIENLLTHKLGAEIGGLLHTARSRNDQIALDMRLYLRARALDFIGAIQVLLHTLTDLAKKQSGIIIPGHTHHQPAQLTTLGHLWLSCAESLVRDAGRFQSWYERFNQNPLGSMTGYGTSFAIDRELTSRLLGFEGPCHNSLDPIQNRWEPEAEMAFAISGLMNHLSNMSQILILFSTNEFGLLRLDDAYCSGSSMMPQKRNPDSLEVIKAKAALSQGLLLSLLGIGRSLFIGYNRETQWTKYLIMDLVDECLPAPQLMAGILATLRLDRKKMAAQSRRGFIAAPDLVERLVQLLGVPFRQTKVAVEKAVKYSEDEDLEKVSVASLKRAFQEMNLDCPLNEEMIEEAQQPENIILRRKATGGPSSEPLRKNIIRLLRSAKDLEKWEAKIRRRQSLAQARLAEMEKSL